MALLELGAGADVTRCPRCQGPMSTPHRGRGAHTRALYIRTCLNLTRGTCDVQTVTSEPPAHVAPPRPTTLILPQALPLEGGE